MPQTEARLVVLLLAVVAVAFVWPCAALMGRYGPRSARAVAAGIGAFFFGVVMPLAELWLYGQLTRIYPIRDVAVWVMLIIEGLIMGGILFYNLYKYDRQRGNNRG
jgi:hypothetical protein